VVLQTICLALACKGDHHWVTLGGIDRQKLTSIHHHLCIYLLYPFQGYRYVHFVDSDAGSPAERPFDLAAYEALLDEYNVMIGQPATSHGGR